MKCLRNNNSKEKTEMNKVEKEQENFKNSHRRLPLYRIIIAGLLILFVFVNFIPSGYYIVEPGPPLPLHDLIEIEDGKRSPDWGEFYLTSVGQKRASLWEVFQFLVLPLNGNRELTPVETTIPPGMDEEEYIELMAQLMEESKLEAQAVAYRAAGYDVNITGQGVEVIEIVSDSPAENNLQQGDIIISINDKNIEMATEAVDIISDRNIGDSVSLTFLRGDNRKEINLKTYENPQREGQASIGVLIRSAELEYEMPEKVTFAESDLVGPSAGIMFALEIYNQLTEDDITGGEKIAGSGEIDHKGNISEVAGMDLKLSAASDENVAKFISSSYYKEELKKAVSQKEIELIFAENFNEVVDKLN